MKDIPLEDRDYELWILFSQVRFVIRDARRKGVLSIN